MRLFKSLILNNSMSRIILNNSIIKELLPDRNPSFSKKNFGYVAVLGGSANYCGAPSLSAMALSALRVGAGVSRVIVEECIAPFVQVFAPEVTLYKVSSFANESEIISALFGLKGLALGMGWGRNKDREESLRLILSSDFDGTLLIDADGLFALKNIGINSLDKCNARVILTPHLGEFSRLVGIDLSLESNLERIALDFAREHNIILLLKGKDTIVTDGKNIYISPTGCVGMATAGSGDVLSGVIIGLSGFLPPLESAYVGTYIAGLAGEKAQQRYGEYGMISSDTIKELAFAIKELRK